MRATAHRPRLFVISLLGGSSGRVRSCASRMRRGPGPRKTTCRRVSRQADQAGGAYLYLSFAARIAPFRLTIPTFVATTGQSVLTTP